jgi:hypothetical protein
MQKKMKLKSTDLKSYPQMLMKRMLRDRLKRVFFLCYASNSIKSQSSTFFGGSCSTPWYFHRRQNPMNSQTYFQKRTVTPFRPYSMSYAGHQFGIGQVN